MLGIVSLVPILGVQYTSFGSNTYRVYDGTYQWIEISGTGTEITDWAVSLDDTYTRIDIPFQFPLYGQSYNKIYVSTNGHIDFAEGLGNGAPNMSENKIPTSSNLGPGNNGWGVNPLIAVLFYDLDLTNGGKVYYQSFGSYFVIQYNEVPVHAREEYGNHTFEVILYNNGNIKIQYKDLARDTDTWGNKPVIGLCLDDKTGVSYDGAIPIHTTQALWFSTGTHPEKNGLPIAQILKILKDNKK